jgi:hypothetical protein
VDDFGNNLSDSNCQPEERIVTQVCNTQSCPKWEVGDWTPVSQVFHERRSISIFSPRDIRQKKPKNVFQVIGCCSS